jgi:hypothetical protein
MHDLPALWLPILATAVLVFIASSVVHMVFKWHNSDYRKVANEDEVMAALRAGSPTPGQYVFPHCSDMKQMQDDAMKNKYEQGPVGIITLLRPGMPNMGKHLAQWFVFCLVMSTAFAAIAVQTFGLAANPHEAGHLIGLVSFLTFFSGSVMSAIWMGKPWGIVAKDLLDSLIYSTVCALTFMWLWPTVG